MAQVLIITGPSGAGKTTTSQQFLQSASGEWAYVNQDEIRQMVVAGYESAGDYEQNWNDGTKRQWAVSIPICADICMRYVEYGINCILDIFAPPEEFEKWKPHLAGIDYKLVVLLPNVDITVARNAGREERSRLKENKIRQNHSYFQEWKNTKAAVLDTTTLSLNEVLKLIRT